MSTLTDQEVALWISDLSNRQFARIAVATISEECPEGKSVADHLGDSLQVVQGPQGYNFAEVLQAQYREEKIFDGGDGSNKAADLRRELEHVLTQYLRLMPESGSVMSSNGEDGLDILIV